MIHAKSIKIYGLLVSAIILASIVFAACATASDKPKAALITSSAGANDKGINESAINGLEKAKKDLGIEYKVIESADIPGSLTQLAAAGYKLIFDLSGDHDALIKGISGDEPIAAQYPDTTFVIFNDDKNINTDGSYKFKNIICVLFDAQEASFLAGALSVLVNENASALFNSADYAFTQGDPGRKTGFIGSSGTPDITALAYGYAEGINYEAKKLNVKYTMFSVYDPAYNDPSAAAVKASAFYADGANMILSAANGIEAKAKEVKKLSLGIGSNKDNLQPGHVLGSILLNSQVPVMDIITHYKNKTMAQIQGKVLSFDLASGGTALTDLTVIGSKVNASGQAKWIDIKKELADIKARIQSGEIKITNQRATAASVYDKSKLTNLTLPNE